MFDWLTGETWLTWGIGLLIGFPLLMILFGELLFRLESPKSDIRTNLSRAQYLVLPALVVYLLLSKVLELSHDIIWVRIAATLFWLSLIYLCLAIFNLIWLKKSQQDTWQNRVPSLVINIARLFFILLGTAFVLSLVWKLDLGRMLAALGVGSIVLGLALQDTLGGLFSGITLISARQFKVGDWLKTGDVVGQVITVNWYSVTLKTFEQDLLVIPNSVLAKDTFQNYSQPSSLHMERITIQFWEEHPPNKVRQALLEAALSTPGVLHEPAPQIVLRELTDDAGAYEALLYFEDYAIIDDIHDAYMTRAWYSAKRHGIIFPVADQQIFHYAGTDLDIGSKFEIKPEQLASKLLILESFNLTKAELETLTKNAQVLRFAAGEQIVRAGDECHHFYVMLTGNARKYLIDIHDKQQAIGPVLPGDTFGIVSLMRHHDSLVSIYTHSDTEVAKIPFESINTVLKNNPRFAQELEQDIETRLENIQALRAQSHRNKNSANTNGSMQQNKDKALNLRALLKTKSVNKSANDT